MRLLSLNLVLLLFNFIAGQEQPEQNVLDFVGSNNETMNSETHDGNDRGNKKLKKEMKAFKGQMEEMMTEIRNQNHAIFKQADHNRILSGKVP